MKIMIAAAVLAIVACSSNPTSLAQTQQTLIQKKVKVIVRNNVNSGTDLDIYADHYIVSAGLRYQTVDSIRLVAGTALMARANNVPGFYRYDTVPEHRDSLLWVIQ